MGGGRGQMSNLLQLGGTILIMSCGFPGVSFRSLYIPQKFKARPMQIKLMLGLNTDKAKTKIIRSELELRRVRGNFHCVCVRGPCFLRVGWTRVRPSVHPFVGHARKAKTLGSCYLLQLARLNRSFESVSKAT